MKRYGIGRSNMLRPARAAIGVGVGFAAGSAIGYSTDKKNWWKYGLAGSAAGFAAGGFFGNQISDALNNPRYDRKVKKRPVAEEWIYMTQGGTVRENYIDDLVNKVSEGGAYSGTYTALLSRIENRLRWELQFNNPDPQPFPPIPNKRTHLIPKSWNANMTAVRYGFIGSFENISGSRNGRNVFNMTGPSQGSMTSFVRSRSGDNISLNLTALPGWTTGPTTTAVPSIKTNITVEASVTGIPIYRIRVRVIR